MDPVEQVEQDARLVYCCDLSHVVVLTIDHYLALQEWGEAVFCPECRRVMSLLPVAMNDLVLRGGLEQTETWAWEQDFALMAVKHERE